jgi:hypothetical protein
MLTYAAVPVTQLSSASRAAYSAYVRYAVGPGQVQGTTPGQLPPGYAPLTAALRAQALTAADEIAAGRLNGNGGGGSSGGAGSGSGGLGSGGAGSGTGANRSGSGGSGRGGGPANGSAGGAGLGATQPQTSLAAQRTPASVLNALRLAILVTFLAGFTAAVASPIVSGRRKLPIPRLRIRRSPGI